MILSGVFHSMIPYVIQSPPAPESLLELKFKELLFNLLINPQNNLLLSWILQLPEDDQLSLKTVMETNYTHNLSLHDFSRLAKPFAEKESTATPIT